MVLRRKIGWWPSHRELPEKSSSLNFTVSISYDIACNPPRIKHQPIIRASTRARITLQNTRVEWWTRVIIIQCLTASRNVRVPFPAAVNLLKRMTSFPDLTPTIALTQTQKYVSNRHNQQQQQRELKLVQVVGSQEEVRRMSQEEESWMEKMMRSWSKLLWTKRYNTIQSSSKSESSFSQINSSSKASTKQ